MRAGATASAAVEAVTAPDSGRAWRQLAALDRAGGVGAFTGDRNDPFHGSRAFSGGIASGNILAGPGVLTAMATVMEAGGSPLAERLLSTLEAARAAGGDSRGLLSAALLVLRRDAPPLTLRIDHADDPLGALRALHARTREADYSRWLTQVPCPDDPERRPG